MISDQAMYSELALSWRWVSNEREEGGAGNCPSQALLKAESKIRGFRCKLRPRPLGQVPGCLFKAKFTPSAGKRLSAQSFERKHWRLHPIKGTETGLRRGSIVSLLHFFVRGLV